MDTKDDMKQLALIQTIKIFCCYDKRNKDFWEEIKSHLSLLTRLYPLTINDNQTALIGLDHKRGIDNTLNNANIILLLISHYFFASDHCWDLMCQSMQNYEIKKTLVIPILLSPVDYEGAPIDKLLILPRDKAITQWSDHQEAYVNISINIRETVETILASSTNIHNNGHNTVSYQSEKIMESDEVSRLQSGVQGGLEAS